MLVFFQYIQNLNIKIIPIDSLLACNISFNLGNFVIFTTLYDLTFSSILFNY